MNSYLKVIPTLLFIFFSNGKAEELPPGKMLLPKSALAEYEAKIDHARLIKDKSKKIFKIGDSDYSLNHV